MASRNNFNFDESRLKPGQRKAALQLVENEFLPKNERKPLREIWEEAGVTQMTLWRWRHEDENFIAYKNYLAATVMDEHLPFVYAALIKGIERGSMKGIELYLKRMGDLDIKQDITLTQAGEDESIEERVKRLQERMDGLNEE